MRMRNRLGQPVHSPGALVIHATHHVERGRVQNAFLNYWSALSDAGYGGLAVLPASPSDRQPAASAVIEPAVGSRSVMLQRLAAMRMRRRCARDGRRPAAFVVHDGRALPLLKRAWPEVPSIVVNHGGDASEMVGADLVICVVERLRREVIAAGQLSSSTAVVPNFVDIPRAPKGLQGRRPAQRFTVGALGRLNAARGFDVLLKALAKLRARGLDVGARIGGVGPGETALRRLAAQLGVAVEFCGWVEHKASFFAGVDVFCLPASDAVFATALLEAMAHAVPVVATKYAGPVDVVADGRTALLTPPDNADALAAMLEVVHRNSEAAAAMARCARREVEARYGFTDNATLVARLVQREIACASRPALTA